MVQYTVHPLTKLSQTYLQRRHRDLSQGATAQLLVLCNRTAVHNQLLQHGFQTAWLGQLRITTTSSAAGATARIAVIVQTGCGFLSGGRRGASANDREDCYGRATVALTRAIQHTYVVSPLNMSGMIGMAQTLAVYHYGYYILKAGQIHSHESAIVPSDAAAVLEWNLDVPFTLLDKPPLAIATIVTINGERSLRRYRLVIAQKSKLRLAPEVLRRPDGSVGMALVLPALTNCRWWFESLLVHSGVSSATRRKATGADHKKKPCT